jgi:hypothetical protein
MPETADTLHVPGARGLGIGTGTPVGTATTSQHEPHRKHTRSSLLSRHRLDGAKR